MSDSPCEKLILEQLELWDREENYKLQEDSLALLFREFCPTNNNIQHILLKVSTLNDFYSTHIYGTFAVAKHILDMRIDERLRCVDYRLVNELAKIKIREGKEINFYSFASKYCSHHNPLYYPIFDSYVSKMLLYYNKIDKFASFCERDMKNYETFVDIIRCFQHSYGLEMFTLRDIDIFLWKTGKKTFPKSYSKVKISPKVAYDGLSPI